MNPKKILVVEDSADYRVLLKQILELEGFEVETAGDGHEGIEKLKAMPASPHLILLDLMMPIMNGFEFRDAQNREPRWAKIPVVLMTAHGDAQESRVKIGAKDHFRKPAHLDQIVEIVKRNLA